MAAPVSVICPSCVHTEGPGLNVRAEVGGGGGVFCLWLSEVFYQHLCPGPMEVCAQTAPLARFPGDSGCLTDQQPGACLGT